jgi:PAS domain S-box-containing protein
MKTDENKNLDDDMKKKLLLRQYQSMVDETNIVSKTDLNGRITYINSKFLEISGYSKEELMGKAHNIVRDPDMPSSVFKNLWETIQSKKSWNGVVTNRRKDGTKYTVEASIFPILNENQEIIEYISIRHDITELIALNKKLDDINKNRNEQELLAKTKLESGIVNDLFKKDYEIVFKASDIVNGDFYSIYKMNNGSTFVCLIDGQGHGISPALTVFAVSSMLKTVIYDAKDMHELISELHPNIKNFLSENEQISYTMLMISPDKKSLTYSTGGMYPFLIKKGDEVVRVKANNTPFMDFSYLPNSNTIDIDGWESIMLYTDGIIEHEHENIKKLLPDEIIKEPSSISDALEKISACEFEDDVTLIYLKNN